MEYNKLWENEGEVHRELSRAWAARDTNPEVQAKLEQHEQETSELRESFTKKISALQEQSKHHVKELDAKNRVLGDAVIAMMTSSPYTMSDCIVCG